VWTTTKPEYSNYTYQNHPKLQIGEIVRQVKTIFYDVLFLRKNWVVRSSSSFFSVSHAWMTRYNHVTARATRPIMATAIRHVSGSSPTENPINSVKFNRVKPLLDFLNMSSICYRCEVVSIKTWSNKAETPSRLQGVSYPESRRFTNLLPNKNCLLIVNCTFWSYARSKKFWLVLITLKMPIVTGIMRRRKNSDPISPSSKTLAPKKQNITCKRGSTMNRVIRTTTLFICKHAVIRHLPSRNPSTDQYEILHNWLHPRDYAMCRKMFRVGSLKAAHRWVK
jgi:hypothetical protein